MLQPKHPVASLISGLVQGLFRAGHLSLIALGLFALSQIAPLSLPAGQSQRGIDALGGAADGVALPASYQAQNQVARTTVGWLRLAQGRLADAISALNPTNVVAEAPEAVVIDEPAPAIAADVARLTRYLSTRYRVSDEVVANLIVKAQHVGRETGLDPVLIVSVMAVESSFNPLSESAFGAQGLMQVIPKYHMDKIGDDSGKLALFEPETNIRVGALVLREYIKRTGSVESGLQTYAGAADDPEQGYARKVLGTRDKFQQVMRG